MNYIRTKYEILKAQLLGAVHSKVVWFNAVMLALIDQLPTIAANLALVLPEVQPYIGPSLYKYAFLMNILINLYLRFKTKTALEAK